MREGLSSCVDQVSRKSTVGMADNGKHAKNIQTKQALKDYCSPTKKILWTKHSDFLKCNEPSLSYFVFKDLL